MTLEKQWLKAVSFTKEKHEGQSRMGGDAYITHPLAVVEILNSFGYNGEFSYVGLFHDLLEDTDATPEEIYSYAGVGRLGESVLKAVELLTKRKGYCMEEYIQKISQNELAKIVKLADRLHNLQSALVASEKFRKRYIAETEQYYISLAAGTCFEESILQSLKELKHSLMEVC